jgi:hypothetical protein
MQFGLNPLEFETHRAHYEAVFGVNLAPGSDDFKNLSRARYALTQALKAHAIAVHDPLRDLFLQVAAFTSNLHNQQAIYYMRYGAGRRMNMIFHGYNSIVWNAPVDRTAPLSRDEQNILNEAINIIYMHLLGVLDNSVLSILHEREPEAATHLRPQEISLFSGALKDIHSFRALDLELGGLREWLGDVKTRRNPVVHRIPLHIVPAMLDSEEAEQYKALDLQFYDAIKNLEFELAEEVNKRKDELGRFAPYFTHHPDDGGIALYPTLPADMANLIRIGRTVFAHLKRKIT